nr:MAG TPA: hypothetical protein [Caudoviricetes sp.]
MNYIKLHLSSLLINMFINNYSYDQLYPCF